MKGDPEAYELALREELLIYLQGRARELAGAATLRYVDPDPGKDEYEYEHPAEDTYTAGHWALTPARADAAEVQWHVSESDAYSTYLQVGRTWTELWAKPRLPATKLLSWIDEIVAAAVAGRFTEHEWYSKRTGKLVGLKGRIQYEPDGRWRTLDTRDAPPPLLRGRFYDHNVRQYAPYR